MKVLTFFVNEKKYGVSIENIITVEKNNRSITDIPNANKVIRGVVNVRSKICPVIDLKMYIDNERNELTEEKKLILFEYEDKDGALLVDDTDNIVDITDAEIEEFDTGKEMTQVVNREDGVFVLLDIKDFDSFSGV